MTVEDRFIPKAKLREAGIPYHPDYAMKLAKQGLFPKPVRLSSQRVGFMKSALDGWLAEKAAA